MTQKGEPRRVFYAASVHDESEIEAVVDVLRDPRGLWVGRRVGAMEQAIAPLFGKGSGVMVNSGSSALYLAIELLGAQPGDEVIGSAVTFSTDISPIVRAGLVPVFVDVEPDTYVVDVDAIEAMITDRTRALLIPNLIGNVPDWDAIRQLADRHGILVIEDSCDALGATLRGTPDRHAIRLQRDQLRLLAHHHVRRRGRDAAAGRRGSSGTGRSSSAAGVGAPSCTSSGRSGATTTSGRISTGSTTTTSSSSTSWRGISSRRSSARPSDSNS